MNTAALGRSILIAQPEGDRPAVITTVYSNTSVEACAFMPLPERLKVVTIHADRREAINAGLKNATGYHAYWPAKV
jgi:hypothetical protein